MKAGGHGPADASDQVFAIFESVTQDPLSMRLAGKKSLPWLTWRSSLNPGKRGLFRKTVRSAPCGAAHLGVRRFVESSVRASVGLEDEAAIALSCEVLAHRLLDAWKP